MLPLLTSNSPCAASIISPLPSSPIGFTAAPPAIFSLSSVTCVEVALMQDIDPFFFFPFVLFTISHPSFIG
ncbi:hypothetical protein GOP47_0013910 [Adiantum capillus-veneris]|uniref:Uncharacterized protein n=1 Tax=Adiantum capillus-veneris TaxID=13818 RepID=A0A9D4UPE9_ADICA|nr:hypothetical protein GOP47_0013910 [Adiantum capillus-veneris]